MSVQVLSPLLHFSPKLLFSIHLAVLIPMCVRACVIKFIYLCLWNAFPYTDLALQIKLPWSTTNIRSNKKIVKFSIVYGSLARYFMEKKLKHNQLNTHTQREHCVR